MKKNNKCSFCKKIEKDFKKLFIGNKVVVCYKCVMLCNSILNKDFKRKEKKIFFLKPTEIKKIIDKHVIGQEKTKKEISVAIYNHTKRIYLKKEKNIEINKNNIIMVGQTGSGKTLIAKTISKIINVPFIITDATSLTEAGYVGEDVENILYKLLLESNFDTRLAEKGIVYIDEIDKIAKKNNGNNNRDISGEGVQQALLKIIEGTKTTISIKNYKKNSFNETIQINTSNILFICGGAFTGISKKVVTNYKKSFLKKDKIKKKKRYKIGIKELINYGLIPEFVGRFSMISLLNPLKKKDFIKIILKTKNSIIKQYKMLFLLDGIKITFSKKAIIKISEKAYKLKTGARGIKYVMEKILLEIMYYIPSMEKIKKIIINSKFLKNKKPIIIKGV